MLQNVEAAEQFSINVSCGKCVTWKNSKNFEYLRHQSTDFHKIFAKIIAL